MAKERYVKPIVETLLGPPAYGKDRICEPGPVPCRVAPKPCGPCIPPCGPTPCRPGPCLVIPKGR